MASQSRSGRRSVWDRLGPLPGDEQAPKFVARESSGGKELGSRGSSRNGSRSGSPRAGGPQPAAFGGRSSGGISSRAVHLDAENLSVVIKTASEAEPGCSTPTTSSASRRLQPTRLLTHSLRQARHSRGMHSGPSSPTASTHSGGSGSWVQPGASRLSGNRGPAAAPESPTGSVSSSGSGSGPFSTSRFASASAGGSASRGGRERRHHEQHRQPSNASIGSARSSPPPGLGGPPVGKPAALAEPAVPGKIAAVEESLATADAIAPAAAAAEELQRRLVQLQAERQVAEELAEQMLRQAEALMAEKARVQAENSALQKEREDLLERLEYWQSTEAPAHDDHSGSTSLVGSPSKGACALSPGRDARALQQQLRRLQQEREELLMLLEASVGLGGLHLEEQGS